MVQPGDVVEVKGLEGAWVVIEQSRNPPLPHMRYWLVRQPMRKRVVPDDAIARVLPPMLLEVGQKVKVPGFKDAVVASIDDGQVRIESTRYTAVVGTTGVRHAADATLPLSFILLANDPRVL